VEATQVAFAQNGKLMALAAPDSRATGPERTIELWDVVSGNMLWSVEAHVNSAGGGAPRCVAFAPDGRNLASGGSDRLVRIWDVTGKKEVASYLTNRPAITSVAFSPDGRLLAAGDDATPELPCEVLLWDLATGERLGVWKTHSGVRQIAFSPDGKTLAVGSSDMKGFVELWSVEEMLGKKGK
jgi:WD40 repeat protein